MDEAKLKELLEKIAREELDFNTLETRNSGDDFQEVAVWCVKNALRRAFLAGQESIRNP